MGDEAGAGFIKVDKLTYDNYPHWKFNMKMCLVGRDLWEIVDGTETLPAEEPDADTRRKFKRRENLAMSYICLSVSTPL